MEVLSRHQSLDQSQGQTYPEEVARHRQTLEGKRPSQSLESEHTLQGFWVRTGGGGRRYVLPRLKPAQWKLLNELELSWLEFFSAASDPRTRRSLERRGLAVFKEHECVVQARLTPIGKTVKDAYWRKQDRKARRENREERRREALP